MSHSRQQSIAGRPERIERPRPPAAARQAPHAAERQGAGIGGPRPAPRASAGQILRASVLILSGVALAALPRLSHADIAKSAFRALHAPGPAAATLTKL